MLLVSRVDRLSRKVRQLAQLHRARHVFALEMRRSDSPEAASAALGHSDVSTTMRHYGHWQPDERAIAFEALASAREGA
jgi:integrase